ncbi:hypothetical protein OO013_05045 [Mangrovivirga sp. M17]|uniref:DUF4293 family protein n=1 Tax=Mangrovivirga halotolerans TaxID=2993936 RepID=A0ABT3RN38_9BACT|nr:hypothetical protein [Mangrovivirga halotolerans]MCX2743219.1 hypothetical protein [Mangrovivirga halotolerans]
MKTESPQWGITVGIILILLGLFGLFSNYSSLTNSEYNFKNPRTANMSAKMDSLSNSSPASNRDKNSELINQGLNEPGMYDRNIHYDTAEQSEPSLLLMKWMRNFCLFGLALGVINIIAGMMLIKRHRWTIRIVEVIIILNINYYLFQTIIILTDNTSGLVGRITAYNKFLAAFIFISLLVVTLIYSKRESLKTKKTIDNLG